MKGLYVLIFLTIFACGTENKENEKSADNLMPSGGSDIGNADKVNVVAPGGPVFLAEADFFDKYISSNQKEDIFTFVNAKSVNFVVVVSPELIGCSAEENLTMRVNSLKLTGAEAFSSEIKKDFPLNGLKKDNTVIIYDEKYEKRDFKKISLNLTVTGNIKVEGKSYEVSLEESAVSTGFNFVSAAAQLRFLRLNLEISPSLKISEKEYEIKAIISVKALTKHLNENAFVLLYSDKLSF